MSEWPQRERDSQAQQFLHWAHQYVAAEYGTEEARIAYSCMAQSWNALRHVQAMMWRDAHPDTA